MESFIIFRGVPFHLPIIDCEHHTFQLLSLSTYLPSFDTFIMTTDEANHENNRSSSSTASSSSSSSSALSALVFRNYKGDLPVFFDSEVKVDKLLGTGSFCMAWTIKQVQLSQRQHRLPNGASRRLLAERVNTAVKNRDPNLSIYGKPKSAEDTATTATPRCVVKRLRTDLYAHFDDMSRAQEDLKAELELLLQVGMGEHPNIIELFAIGISSAEPDARVFPSSNNNNNNSADNGDTPSENGQSEEDEHRGLTFQPTFLIISRIQCTLETMLVKWRDQRGLGVYEALSLQHGRDLWLERMLVLTRIADAVAYLHSKRIIFRDLKPENIGKDDNGMIKIFDFGLAKQIDESQHSNGSDTGLHGLYQLTGNTGTARYMPPEVAHAKPYGFGVDVYSLAIVIYQVLSLKVPFHNIPVSTYFEQVFDHGVRPPVDPSWPPALRELLPRMWQADPTQRPTAAQVATAFSEMLRGTDEELFPASAFSSVNRWFSVK